MASRELIAVLSRIADALDRAIPIAEPWEAGSGAGADGPDLDPEFTLMQADEEALAVLEILESATPGHVPAEAYRKLGVEPPSVDLLNYDERDEELFSASQPGIVAGIASVASTLSLNPDLAPDLAPSPSPDPDEGIMSTRKIALSPLSPLSPLA